MELMTVITVLCISLSLLLTPSYSLHVHVPSSKPQEASQVQLSVSGVLPRKLKFAEEAHLEGHGDQDTTLYNRQKEAELHSGKEQKREEEEQEMKLGGRWHEWVERTDTSRFFTMDYSHVRRRRPIHNKSLPVGP